MENANKESCAVFGASPKSTELGWPDAAKAYAGFLTGGTKGFPANVKTVWTARLVLGSVLAPLFAGFMATTMWNLNAEASALGFYFGLMAALITSEALTAALVPGHKKCLCLFGLKSRLEVFKAFHAQDIDPSPRKPGILDGPLNIPAALLGPVWFGYHRMPGTALAMAAVMFLDFILNPPGFPVSLPFICAYGALRAERSLFERAKSSIGAGEEGASGGVNPLWPALAMLAAFIAIALGLSSAVTKAATANQELRIISPESITGNINEKTKSSEKTKGE